MNDTEEPYRAKARECLAGAASELANGRFNNASNRAYYAAYNAAIIALLRAGLASRNNRWDHDEIRARFAGELINRRKLYPSDMGATLVGLSLTRQAVDYGKKQVTRSAAQQSVRDASRFCFCHTEIAMVAVTKPRPIDYYIEKMERKALRKFPHLTFTIDKESDDLVYLYYTPYDGDEFYDIIKSVSGIATDALVDAGYRIWVMPA